MFEVVLKIMKFCNLAAAEEDRKGQKRTGRDRWVKLLKSRS